jgi:hypothetical protein
MNGRNITREESKESEVEIGEWPISKFERRKYRGTKRAKCGASAFAFFDYRRVK